MAHPAERLLQRVPVVFTAHSAETADLRERICAFALARQPAAELADVHQVGRVVKTIPILILRYAHDAELRALRR